MRYLNDTRMSWFGCKYARSMSWIDVRQSTGTISPLRDNSVRLNPWACVQWRRLLIFVFRDRGKEKIHLVLLCSCEIVRENDDKKIYILLLWTSSRVSKIPKGEVCEILYILRGEVTGTHLKSESTAAAGWKLMCTQEDSPTDYC